jgi:hypothetical protein
MYEGSMRNGTHVDRDGTCSSSSCGIDIWAFGSFAVLGGVYGDRQGNEHNVRSPALQDTVFAHINAGNVENYAGIGCGVWPTGAAKSVLTLRNSWGHQAATTLGLVGDELAQWYSTRFSVHDNWISTCDDSINSLNIQAGNNQSIQFETHFSYSVFGNLIDGLNHPGDNGAVLSQFAGVDFMVANNAFHMDFEGGGGVGMRLEHRKAQGPTVGSQPTRGRFYNNSFYVAAGNAQSTIWDIDDMYFDAMISNNIIYDDLGSTLVVDDGGSVDTLFCGTPSGPGACNPVVTANPFDGPFNAPPDLDDYQLNPAYIAANGTGNGLQDGSSPDIDRIFNCREDSTPWEGLDEVDGSICMTATDQLFTPRWSNNDSAVGMNTPWHQHDGVVFPFANMFKQVEAFRTTTGACFSEAGSFLCENMAGVCLGGSNNGTPCDPSSIQCTGGGYCSNLGQCMDGSAPGAPCASVADCPGGTLCSDRGKPVLDLCDNQDANGYPLSMDGAACIQTQLFEQNYADAPYPLGRYDLRWDGTGVVWEVGGLASNLQSTGANSATFDMLAGGTNGQSLQIGITDVGSPSVTNIRMYAPGGACVDNSDGTVHKHLFCDPDPDPGSGRCPDGGCPGANACGVGQTCTDLATLGEAGDIQFHPLWLSRHGQYRIIRHMNWAKTNHSRKTDFDERRPPDFYTYDRQSGRWPEEMPIEPMIDLCNDLNADCYYNMPSLATDQMMDETMRLIRDRLRPNLKLFLEYSNETWLGSFSQTRWAYEDAYIADEAGVWDGADCLTNNTDCSAQWTGKRGFEMCNRAKTVWGETGRQEDVVCVLARRISQSGSEVANTMDCTRWSAQPDCYTNTDWDRLAVNTYLGDDQICDDPPDGPEVPATVQDVCDTMVADIATKLCTGPTCGVRAPADAFEARVPTGRTMAYEGGSSTESGPASTACVDMAVQADSCVRAVYGQALDDWKTLNGTVNIAEWIFHQQGSPLVTDASFGSIFGHRGADEGGWPKESGIVEWDNIAANACWWPGCAIPEFVPPVPPTEVGDGFTGGVFKGGVR